MSVNPLPYGHHLDHIKLRVLYMEVSLFSGFKYTYIMQHEGFQMDPSRADIVLLKAVAALGGL